LGNDKIRKKYPKKMKSIKDWEDFICESTLYSSDTFRHFLEKIGDRISRELLSLLGKDVRTKYNHLDVSDLKGDINFIPDNKSSNVGVSGSLKPSNGTLGRIVGSILRDNRIEFTPSELENFVRQWGAVWIDEFDNQNGFMIVQGPDIKKWYYGGNYSQETLGGKGTLGKSCMRYDECQKYLDIYALNPEVVKMLVVLDPDKKLRARMLIWSVGEEYLLDRCYYTREDEQGASILWLEKNLDKKVRLDSKNGDFVILERTKNSDGTFDYYPYMDSFPYYNTRSRKLQVEEPQKGEENWIILKETSGGFSNFGKVYCNFDGNEYPEEDCFFSDIEDTWMPKTLSVWSDYYRSYIWKELSVFSKKIGAYIMIGDASEVWIDKNKTQKDWLPKVKTMTILEDGGFEFYDKDLKISAVAPKVQIFEYIKSKYPPIGIEQKIRKGFLMDLEFFYKGEKIIEGSSKFAKIGAFHLFKFSDSVQKDINDKFFYNQKNIDNHNTIEGHLHVSMGGAASLYIRRLFGF